MSSLSNPKISVIIPVFNQEKYIGRCLRSILDQTFLKNSYEIIVIDDGSSDRSPYALTLFHDAIRIITNEKNLGLPASLNIGIKAAKGEYIIRVDSDDYVNANFLSFLYTYLDQNLDSDAVACDYWLFNDNEEWLRRVDAQKEPIACGILFRKKDLIEIGLYDEKFRYHEEKDLRIRFEKKRVISYLRLPLYRYRRHENNITNNNEDMQEFKQELKIKHGIDFKEN